MAIQRAFCSIYPSQLRKSSERSSDFTTSPGRPNGPAIGAAGLKPLDSAPGVLSGNPTHPMASRTSRPLPNAARSPASLGSSPQARLLRLSYPMSSAETPKKVSMLIPIAPTKREPSASSGASPRRFAFALRLKLVSPLRGPKLVPRILQSPAARSAMIPWRRLISAWSFSTSPLPGVRHPQDRRNLLCRPAEATQRPRSPPAVHSPGPPA